MKENICWRLQECLAETQEESTLALPEHLKQGYEMTVEALPFSLFWDPLLQVNLFCLSTLTHLCDPHGGEQATSRSEVPPVPISAWKRKNTSPFSFPPPKLAGRHVIWPNCQIPNPSRRGGLWETVQIYCHGRKFLSDLENLEKWHLFIKGKVILKDRDAEQAKPWVPTLSWWC